MTMSPAPRLGCSTISMQHLDLAAALDDIAALGFEEIDLGALPGVCDHVPFEFGDDDITSIARTIKASGLRVRSVNGDTGDLNAPAPDPAARRAHTDRLVRLTAEIGAQALVLPCGALSHEPLVTVEEDIRRVGDELASAAEIAERYGSAIWVESLHFLRLCWNAERAAQLHEATPDSVRAVLDVAHIVAAGDDIGNVVREWGDRTAHVHLRDAVRGDFSRAIGEADVDFDGAFAALAEIGYQGGFTLELPARAYSDDATSAKGEEFREQRRTAIAAAAAYISPRLESTGLSQYGR